MKNALKNIRKRGRPTVLNRYVLRDLKKAYCVDATDKEACSLAGISEKTLYNYQNRNPEFIHQKQVWKASLIFKAREALVNALEGDGRLAFRYLERRLPQEFGCYSVRSRCGNENPSELQEALRRIALLKVDS
jgi:hypothetical protein